jgi:LmbE family N-acetylglucosaminyl deacetylase
MDHAVDLTGCLAETAASGSRVLGVFAHPDDETFCAGGLFARCAERGAEIMVVSATRGEVGQIRDATVGSRRTIAAVREAELRRACARLGVGSVRCLDYVDGTLADADFDGLVADVVKVVREFRPDVVITFGPDGGYGHPDHIAISAATTAACEQAGEVDSSCDGLGRRPPSLYYRHFPPSDMLLMNRLATWLTDQPSRFAGTPAFVHALLVIAAEAGTMGNIRDHSEVRWFPPGSYVVEQGEPATQLFLILSGHADVWQEHDDGQRVPLRHIGPGEFFGELGVAGNRPRSANVVAAQGLTCLVLSPSAPTKYDGRGQAARVVTRRGTEPSARGDDDGLAPAIVEIDISDHITAKIEALCAYRSQFPVEPHMFPDFLLHEIFGREHFVPVTRGTRAPFHERT